MPGENKNMQRMSNFELLRIMAMFFIVIGHFFMNIGAFNSATGFNQIFVYLFGSLARISVNLFILIGAWFMIDKTFKAQRVLKLYFTTLFYTFSIMLTLRLFHIPIGLFNTIQDIFPFYGRALWFITAYIGLMLLSPFLNVFLQQKRDFLKKFIIVTFFLTVVVSTLYSKNRMDTWYCQLSWFCYMYVCVGYYKKYLFEKIRLNKYSVLFFSCLAYFIFAAFKLISYNLSIESGLWTVLNKYAENFLGDYKTLPNLICSFGIFYFVSNWDIGSNRFINLFSRSALAVYIIHSTPGFYDYLWQTIFKGQLYVISPYFPIYAVLVTATVYIVCCSVDYLRLKFAEPILLNSSFYKYIENKMDSFYSFKKVEG